MLKSRVGVGQEVRIKGTRPDLCPSVSQPKSLKHESVHKLEHRVMEILSRLDAGLVRTRLRKELCFHV